MFSISVKIHRRRPCPHVYDVVNDDFTETKTLPRPGYRNQDTTKTRVFRPRYYQDQDIETKTLLRPGYRDQDTTYTGVSRPR